VKPIVKIGLHPPQIQMPELVNMEPVVMKWIFGKLTLNLPKLPLILAQPQDNTDVQVLNVVIMPQEIDITVFVIKTVVISIHTD
jgi:hypothetical protein